MVPPEWFIVGSLGISLIGGKEFAQLIRRTKRSAPGIRPGYGEGTHRDTGWVQTRVQGYTHTHRSRPEVNQWCSRRGCPTIQKAIRGHSTDRSRLEIGKKLGQVASGWKLGTL